MYKLVVEVLDYIKDNHFNSHLIAWDKIYNYVHKIKNKKDLCMLLDKYILPKLNDNNHSNFGIVYKDKICKRSYKISYRKSKFKKYYSKPEKYFSEKVEIKMLENNILYINAPRTWNQDYWIEYYKKITEAFKDYKKLKGIIYDLSECLGGNYIPIIAPFHQIFGRTIVAHGYNKNNDNLCFTHILKKGKLNDIDSWISQIRYNPNKLTDNRSSGVKIAVIVSAYTGSAGEFAAMFFKDRPNVRIFGEKTAGLSTWQNMYNIKNDNGSYLNIGLAYAVDRSGYRYESNFHLLPDVKTSNPIKKAIKYILSSN